MSYTTILETTDRMQLSLSKVALQQADISFKVLHENALTIGDAAAMGGSGAQIQVPFDEIGSARTLLKEQGLLIAGSGDSQFGLLKVLDVATRGIPIIGGLDFSVRLVLMVFLAVAIPLVWYAIQQTS
ncbi:MAG: hypothetical protein AB8G22_28365 [Saprospiraceae bacterium]